MEIPVSFNLDRLKIKDLNNYKFISKKALLTWLLIII